MHKLYTSTTKNCGTGLFTSYSICAGELITKIYGGPLDYAYANEFSIQTTETEGVYIYDTNQGFINHSCRPNCFMALKDNGETRELLLYALMPIDADSELTYNYNTTEYDLSVGCRDFYCKCYSLGCINRVCGWRWLVSYEKDRFLPISLPYIKNIAANRLNMI